MSTLKTHNLQSPDAGSVNIVMAPNAGMVVAGLSTYSNQINVGSNIKLGTAGVITATTFSGDPAGTGNINAGILDLKTGGNIRLRFSSGGTAQFRGDTDPIASFDRGSANSTNVKWGYLGADRGIISSISNEFRLTATGTTPMTFYANSAERLRIASSGSIGIGSIFYHLGDTDTEFGFPSNDSYRLRVAGSTRLYTSSTEPIWHRRDVSAGVSTQTMLLNYNNAGGSGVALAFAPSTNYTSRHSSIEVVNDDGNNNMSMRFKVTDASQNAHAIERMRIATNGKIGINNTNPTHPLHIVNTSSTFNSASLIRGDTSTSGGGAYATFTNTADSKSAYFGVDGNGLFNLDAGAALVGTNGNESIIFATNGNDEKVRILGGTDNVLQIRGGNNLSIVDYAPNHSFSGSYTGYHTDNHGNTLIGLNAHLNYSGTSGTHQWKQTNAHGSIGSAGMFIGGNGSNNNTNITFFRNSQGSSAGTVFGQDSWKFQIGSDLRQNFNERYLQRGFFKTDTNQQNANNFPLAASGIGGYAFGYQEAFSTSSGSWAHPYPNLVLAYHTGMQFGAYHNYGGCRFYADHPSTTSTIYFSVGNGGSGVHVTNTFTAGSNKGFRIAHPHPSKKYTHDLVHNAIEAPQMDLIYRGKIDLVDGSATVNIDTKSNMTEGTFVLLNRDIQCFTSNETGWTAVKGSVSGNILTITAQDNSCTDTISWMVVGERQDDKIKSSELTTADGDLIVEPLTIEETHM